MATTTDQSSTSQKKLRRRFLLGGVVLVVVASAVVAGVVVWARPSSAIAPQLTASAYQVVRQGGVVVAGKDSAPKTIDVYEDFLCSYCGQFEHQSGAELRQRLTDGTLRIRYHELPFLDRIPNSNQYSSRAGNAALCAADAGRFQQFHDTLFANQPSERGPVYDDDKLIDIGRQVGLTAPGFADCVRHQAFAGLVQANLTAVEQLTYLKATAPDGQRVFRGTPSVVIGQTLIDTDNTGWLDEYLGKTG